MSNERVTMLKKKKNKNYSSELNIYTLHKEMNSQFFHEYRYSNL